MHKTPLASCRSYLEGLQGKSISPAVLITGHKRLWQVECMFPWCFVAAGTRIASNCTPGLRPSSEVRLCCLADPPHLSASCRSVYWSKDTSACGVACLRCRACCGAEHLWNQPPSLAVCPEDLSSGMPDIFEQVKQHLGLYCMIDCQLSEFCDELHLFLVSDACESW